MTNTPADQLLQEVKLPGFLGDSNPPWESMSTSTQSWPPGVSLEVLEEARVGGLRFIGSLQSIMILPIGIFLFRGIPHFQTLHTSSSWSGFSSTISSSPGGGSAEVQGSRPGTSRTFMGSDSQKGGSQTSNGARTNLSGGFHKWGYT